MTTPASQIEAYLDEVDPYEFEQFVANLWEEYGFSTEVTSGSQDRGIDIKAEKESPFKQRVLIQAKAYSKENKVDSSDIDRYQILYRQEENVDKVVIISTGTFTRQAKQKAQELDVEAIDRDDLIGLIRDADITVPDTKSETPRSTETVDTESGTPRSTETEEGKYDDLGEPSGTDFVSGPVDIDNPTVMERRRLKIAYDKLRTARGNVDKQDKKDEITDKMEEIEEKLRESDPQ